jgi:hypothetical protein
MMQGYEKGEATRIHRRAPEGLFSRWGFYTYYYYNG